MSVKQNQCHLCPYSGGNGRFRQRLFDLKWRLFGINAHTHAWMMLADAENGGTNE